MNEIASFIDHTLLKPDSTKDEIVKLCNEAKQFNFATVCVNPYWVPVAVKKLKNTDVGITTVIGFPLGATNTMTKVTEAKEVIRLGATEIDMVINIGALKSNEDEFVFNDIKQVVAEANGQVVVKVIIETSLLTDEEKVRACQIAKEAGAQFVKTSTGFSNGGATVEDVALMRKTVGPTIGVKASGGIRNLETVKQMIEAGATRIGASASVQIVTE